jgi:hypothetical protein
MLAVKISGYDFTMFSSSPAQIRAMNRLQACTFTVRQTIKELEDPKDLDSRADLLIQVEELLNEVALLNNLVSKMVWQELDKKNHPSSQTEENDKLKEKEND